MRGSAAQRVARSVEARGVGDRRRGVGQCVAPGVELLHRSPLGWIAGVDAGVLGAQVLKRVARSGADVLIEGDNLSSADAKRLRELRRNRFAMVFQHFNLWSHMTVLENVRIGLQRSLGTSFHFWKSANSLSNLNDRAMQLLAEVDLTEFADTMTVDLPYGRKRALEIATTLAMEPEMMLLDEPTQGMGHEDVHRVTELIKKVSAGRTILMVEHNMTVISSIADKITVLQRGSILAEGNYLEVSSDPRVIEAYMGVADEPLQGAH